MDEIEVENKFYFAHKGDGRVLAVFRVEAGPTIGVNELRWDDNGWVPYDDLIRRIITGDPDLTEVNEETVREVFPGISI